MYANAKFNNQGLLKDRLRKVEQNRAEYRVKEIM